MTSRILLKQIVIQMILIVYILQTDFIQSKGLQDSKKCIKTCKIGTFETSCEKQCNVKTKQSAGLPTYFSKSEGGRVRCGGHARKGGWRQVVGIVVVLKRLCNTGVPEWLNAIRKLRPSRYWLFFRNYDL